MVQAKHNNKRFIRYLRLFKSSVQLVPCAPLLAVDGGKLVARDAVSPALVAAAGRVQTCIAAVFENVLNGENDQPRVARQHAAHERVVAVVPVVAFVAKIGKQTAAVIKPSATSCSRSIKFGLPLKAE